MGAMSEIWGDDDDNTLVVKHSKINENYKLAYCIKKGYRVQGLFQEDNILHGLVYNPHIATWFHAWWDLNGKCLTPNCYDDWALINAKHSKR